MKKIAAIGVVVLLMAAGTVALAQADSESGGGSFGDVALGVKVGTLGIGGDATFGLLPNLNLRANGNYLNWDFTKKIDQVDYDVALDLTSMMLLLDWHPFGNNFRISGGAAFNNQKEVNLTATTSAAIDIGDHQYSPAEIGSLTGTLGFQPVAPYVGIGYGNAVGKGGHFSFIFDLGVIYQTYDVTLAANGLAAQNPQFVADLEKQRQDVEDTFNQYKVYPVLDFGIAYKF